MFVFLQQETLGRKVGISEMHLSPLVALADVHSNGGGSVIVDSLFIAAAIVYGVQCLVLALLNSVLCPF